MQIKGKTILVTGGAGFIGSHLCDKLVGVSNVIVYDNLSSGSIGNIQHNLHNSNFNFVQGDLLDANKLERSLAKAEIVFHLAANPEVPAGAGDTQIDMKQNVLATQSLLEGIRKSKTVKQLVFASTSTVYGEPSILPTPETYGPLQPISLYGASKVACEALISAYGNLFSFSYILARLANVVGLRMKRGVVVDFIRKLRENPSELEILGDGTQTKSYLAVEDCVDALIIAAERSGSQILNVGSDDAVDVVKIANMVTAEMGAKGVRHRMSPGIDGRGWPGDVKNMLLDNRKIKSLGWLPAYPRSEDAIQWAIRSQLAPEKGA